MVNEKIREWYDDFSGEKLFNKRKEWFLEKYDSISDLIDDVKADDLNEEWVEKFGRSNAPLDLDQSKLQSEISRIAILRKAVLDEYVAEGTHFLEGIDHYRFASQQKELISDALKEINKE